MSDLTSRDFENLNQSVRDLNNTLKEMRTEMAQTYVRKDVFEPTITDMRKDIEAHDSWLTWAQRLVIGLVITALVALVLATGGVPS